jgi:hypothetical protein
MAQYNFNLGYGDQARAFAADLEKNYPDYLPAKLMQLQLTLGTSLKSKSCHHTRQRSSRTIDKTPPDSENSAQLLSEIREKAYLARGTAQLQLKK